MSGRARAKIAGLLLLIAIATPGRAAELRDGVEQLFSLSTKVSPTVLAKVSEHYQVLVEGGVRDPRIDYAFALVLIEQQKFDDAASKLDQVVKKSPNDLHARRARVWIQLLKHDYEKALAGLESLSKCLAARQTGDNISTVQHETANFLGRAFGYLEGPATSSKLEKLVGTSKERVLGKLGSSFGEDFEQGHAESAATFDKLNEEIAGARATATEQEEQAIKAQAEQLETEKASVAEGQKELEDKFEEKTDETKKEVEEIATKLGALRESYSVLMAKAAPLQAQRLAAQNEIRALTIIVQDGNGVGTITYRNRDRVRQLEAFITGLEIQLAPVTAEANAMNARVLALQNKYNMALGEHQQEAQKLGNQQQALVAKEKKLANIEKHKSKTKPTGNSVKVRTLSAKIAMFSTYDPFPLEQEQARVLDSLK